MVWAFIVCRENSVDRVRIFEDYFEGEQFANNFISQINPDIKEFPKYRQSEFYRNDDISIGLYRDDGKN